MAKRKLSYIEQLIRLFTASQQELIRLLQTVEPKGTVAQYRKELLKQTNKELALLNSKATPLMESLVQQSYAQGIIYVNRKLGKKMISTLKHIVKLLMYLLGINWEI